MNKLADARRLALNICYDSPRTTATRETLLSYPGVTFEVLAELVDHGDLIALTADGNWPKELDRATFSQVATFRLTSAGEQFVEDDPMSALLRRVSRDPQQCVRLQDLRLGRHDRDTVVTAWQHGWLTLHFAGDMRETKFSRNGAEEWKFPADYAVKLTSKARRQVIG